MEVNFAHICDYANVSQEGKLNIMGIFVAIHAPKLPATHPMMYLAFELGFDYTEFGKEFTLEFQIVDEDGGIVFNAKSAGKMQSTRTPKPGDAPTLGQIVPIVGLTFERFGSYDVNIFANGRAVKRLPLKVVPMAVPTGPIQ